MISPMIPLSVLDLSTINAGSDASQAFRNTVDLARHAEHLGYTRYWLAEHHNMPGIASAATAVVIGHVAGATSRIRVGAGGIMLPNHAPLIIAEQFGTLAAMYPGRIDLALGRAPGTDQNTMRALRRDPRSAEFFPQDVVELLSYFEDSIPGQMIRAVPGAGLHVPVWLLGSSTYSAQLAAQIGVPFAFASHFAPAQLHQALELYRSGFEPSDRLAKPYAMVAVSVIAADTDAEARRLFSSLQQQFIALQRGQPIQLQPPVDDLDSRITAHEKHGIEHTLRYAIVGGPSTVRRKLAELAAETGADEVIVTANIHDHEARKRSYEILAEANCP
ncbi:MAG: yhbW [Gemmatimonadetes bacterium]|nr:yhbW [Gemmatimonadota bacterium]